MADAARSALFVICTAASCPAAEINVTDDLQRTVSLDRPAGRIVSLAPHLTELLHSAQAGGKLVGVSRHCNYPPSVTELPKVSDHATINYELITELQPDLILVWNAGLKDVSLRKLTSLYQKVYVSDPSGFEGIAENLAEIGALAGNSIHARQTATAFLRNLDELAERYARSQPVKTLYLLWHNPPMTVGGNHWISRTISLCGGTNVFTDSTAASVVRLNREWLRLAQADVVLHSLPDQPQRPSALDKLLGPADQAPVFYIEGDLVQRPSLRLAQSAARLCRIIHRAGSH